MGKNMVMEKNIKIMKLYLKVNIVKDLDGMVKEKNLNSMKS